MQSSEDNNIIMIKLDDGEDLFASLEAATMKHGIRWGVFLTGVGMLRDFETGYWTGKEYLAEFHEEPHELLHYGGSIAEVDGKPAFHIHVTLAGQDHRVIGGHINKGTVAVLNEICIRKFENLPMTRELSERSTLMELKLE
jgi:uncharacterized protein